MHMYQREITQSDVHVFNMEKTFFCRKICQIPGNMNRKNYKLSLIHSLVYICKMQIIYILIYLYAFKCYFIKYQEKSEYSYFKR